MRCLRMKRVECSRRAMGRAPSSLARAANAQAGSALSSLARGDARADAPSDSSRADFQNDARANFFWNDIENGDVGGRGFNRRSME
jgi:hypothetical protein